MVNFDEEKITEVADRELWIRTNGFQRERSSRTSSRVAAFVARAGFSIRPEAVDGVLTKAGVLVSVLIDELFDDFDGWLI